VDKRNKRKKEKVLRKGNHEKEEGNVNYKIRKGRKGRRKGNREGKERRMSTKEGRK